MFWLSQKALSKPNKSLHLNKNSLSVFVQAILPARFVDYLILRAAAYFSTYYKVRSQEKTAFPFDFFIHFFSWRYNCFNTSKLRPLDGAVFRYQALILVKFSFGFLSILLCNIFFQMLICTSHLQSSHISWFFKSTFQCLLISRKKRKTRILLRIPLPRYSFDLVDNRLLTGMVFRSFHPFHIQT